MLSFSHIPRIVLTVSFAAFGLMFVPAAHAASYCVGTHPDCPVGATTYTATAANLDTALAAAGANAGPTTLYIGAGTFTDNVNGFDVVSNNDLLIIGAGASATILETQANFESALHADFDGCGVIVCGVRDLGVAVNGAPTGLAVGLDINEGTATRVDARLTGNPGNGRGIFTHDGSVIVDSTIELAGVDGIGAGSGSGGSTYRNVTITGTNSAAGFYNVAGDTNTATLDRVTVRGVVWAVWAIGGTTDISDSLFDLGTIAQAHAIEAGNSNTSASNTQVWLKRSTVVGSGTGQIGVNGFADNGTEIFGLETYGSLIHLSDAASRDIACLVNTGFVATITGSFNALDAASMQLNLGSATCSNSLTSTVDTAAATVRFVDAAGGDYRPTWNSAVVDASKPTGTTGVGAFDRGGSTRVVDGNGSGGAQEDIGAFEYQRKAPTGVAASCTATALVGQTVTCTGTAATDPEGEAITYAWHFDDGADVAGLDAQHAFTTAGSHTATLTATDAAGATASAVASSSITAPVVVVTPDTTAPVLGKLTFGIKPFTRTNKPFSFAPAAFTGPTVRGTASEAGTMRIEVLRLAAGRKVGSRCVAPTAANIANARCTRRVKVGAASLALSASGAYKLRFGGRLGTRQLPAGAYVLLITVRDAAGNTSSAKSIVVRLA